MTVWADVDAWKAQRVAAEIVALEADVQQRLHSRESDRALRHRQKSFDNLLKRFRELPAEVAEGCVAANRSTTPPTLHLSSPAAQVAIDWLETHGLTHNRPIKKHPMCAADVAMVAILAGVRMSPGSRAKRFARQLAQQGSEITHGQAVELRRLVTKFRRQIRPEQLPPYARWLLDKPNKPRTAR